MEIKDAVAGEINISMFSKNENKGGIMIYT
jgi:hypothetical protein